MLTKDLFKKEILTPIRSQFYANESLANAYCVIWAVDSYATHVALEGVKITESSTRIESDFKRKAVAYSWQFRVVREASNATKHAIRHSKTGRKTSTALDVLNSSDVRPDTGVSFYAYFNNVDGGVTIRLDWEYNSYENVFYDRNGKVVEGYRGIGNEVYLSTIIDDAIKAIDFLANPS